MHKGRLKFTPEACDPARTSLQRTHWRDGHSKECKALAAEAARQQQVNTAGQQEAAAAGQNMATRQQDLAAAATASAGEVLGGAQPGAEGLPQQAAEAAVQQPACELPVTKTSGSRAGSGPQGETAADVSATSPLQQGVPAAGGGLVSSSCGDGGSKAGGPPSGALEGGGTAAAAAGPAAAGSGVDATTGAKQHAAVQACDMSKGAGAAQQLQVQLEGLAVGEAQQHHHHQSHPSSALEESDLYSLD